MTAAALDTAALLAIEDVRLSTADARTLLAAIDAWCLRTLTPDAHFGQMAVDFGGFVGLLRRRGPARGRMAALCHDFMKRWPGGVPAGLRDDERRRAFHVLMPIRVPNLRRNLRSMAAQKQADSAAPPPPPAYPDGREPCFWCGVRGDIGCTHRHAAWTSAIAAVGRSPL